MDNTVKQDDDFVEPCNFENDFQILTLKEKRAVLKNARHLLELQKKDTLFSYAGSCR